MTTDRVIRHKFIELLPETLEEGVLYVSIQYKGMAHLCFCGCGSKVVTPLSPTGWSITFDGKSVTVNPSIGSWRLPCRSHYWIRENRIDWAPLWSEEMIRAGYANDTREKHAYHLEHGNTPSSVRSAPPRMDPRPNALKRALRWFYQK